MMKKAMCMVIGLMAMACGGNGAVQAGTVSFGYEEPLNRSWSREVLHFIVRVPANDCDPATMYVTDESGAPVPAQFADPQPHREVKDTPLTVTVVADFEPWQRRTWTLHYGATPPPTPDTGLTSRTEDGALVLDNGRIAVRTGAGRARFDTPAEAATVPAPILAVRGPSGAWIGRGWLESPRRVTGYDIALTHDGPIYKRVRAEYAFDGGRYICEVTLRAGEEVVHIREEFDLGDPAAERASNFCFSLSPGLTPDTVRWTGRYYDREFNPGEAVFGYRKMQEAAFPVNYDAPGRLLRLHGLFVWWPQAANYYGAYRADDPDSDLVAFFPMRPGHWRNPTAIMLDTTPERELVARAPLRQPMQVWTVDGVDYGSPYWTGTVHPGTPRTLGVREWGLLVTRASEVIAQGDDFTRSGIRKAWTRYGQNPLDKIKDWVLDWPDPGPDAYPRGAITRAELPALRDRVARVPALQALVGSPQHKRFAYLVTGDEAIGHDLVYNEAGGDANWMGILPRLRWSAGCYLDTQGDLGINTFMHHGNGHVMGGAPLFDVALSVPAMTAAERREARALYAFLSYKLSDPDWLAYGTGFHLGNPNMPTMSLSVLGEGAALIPEHPMANDWMMRSVKSNLDMLRDFVAPGGAWRECPHYQLDASLKGVVQAADALKNAGFMDLYQNLNFKATMLYNAQILTPVDPRFGVRSLPPIGNTAWSTSSLHGRMAAGTAVSDPEFARWMQWAWRSMGSPYMYPNDELRLNADLPAEMPDLRSRHFPGFGAVMRAHADGPKETYLTFRMGFNVEHYEDDQGSIMFYARGIPLALDFGSLYQPMMLRPYLHNRVSFNRKVNWHGVGAITETAFLDAADACLGSLVNDRVFDVPEDPLTPTPPNVAPPMTPMPPTTWTRQVVLVKDADPDGPHYLVLRDGLEGAGDEFTEFNLWVLADRLDVQGGTARYQGQLGLDLTVTVLDPAAPAVETTRYGHEFLYGPMVKPWRSVNGDRKFEEIQHGLRIRRDDHGGYFTVLYPHAPDETPPVFTAWADGAGARATIGGETHTVVCATTPGRYAGDGIVLQGRRALVRERDGHLHLALLGGHSLKAGAVTLAAPGPAAITLAGGTLSGEAHLADPGAVSITAPAVVGSTATVTTDAGTTTIPVARDGDTLTLRLPAGRCRFVFNAE